MGETLRWDRSVRFLVALIVRARGAWPVKQTVDFVARVRDYSVATLSTPLMRERMSEE
jgi:hypothetical protein